MKLRDLTSAHLGKIITIESPHFTIRGVLVGVNHWWSLVDDTIWVDPASGAPQVAIRNEYAGVTIAGWGEKEFDPDQECEIEGS